MKFLFLVPTFIMVSCGSAVSPTAMQPTAIENTVVMDSEPPRDSLPSGFWQITNQIDNSACAYFYIDENNGFYWERVPSLGAIGEALGKYSGTYSLLRTGHSYSLLLTDFCDEFPENSWDVTAISHDEISMTGNLSCGTDVWTPQSVTLHRRVVGVFEKIDSRTCN